MAKGCAMFKTIFQLLLLFLLANGLVLQGPKLIDFGFCFVLASIFALLFLLRKSKGKNNRYVRLDKHLKYLALLSWFFLSMAWVAAYSLWQLDHRLEATHEGKSFWVQGQVNGLPDQETNRIVFELLAEKFWHCSEEEISECKNISLNEKPLPIRFLSLAITDSVWFYFFRNVPTETSLNITTSAVPSAMPKKIRVALYQFANKGELNVQAGERYQLLLKLRRPRSSLNFSGFDYETWLFTQGIHANAYVKKHEANIMLATESNFVAKISKLREGVRKKIIEISKQSKQSKGNINQEVSQAVSLILALTIGDRVFLSSENNQLLVNTGTAHLLSISGMHISLMSGLTFIIVFNLVRIVKWLIAIIKQNRVIKFVGQRKLVIPVFFPTLSPIKIAALFSVIVAIVYSLLAGFSMPTQRSLIMVLCYSLGLIFYRHVNFYGLWCLAMLLIVIHNPFAVLDSGFYLSFIAVFFIQWVLLGYFNPDNQGVINKLNLGFKAQLSVFIGLSPLSVLFFSGFYPLTILCNIFAVPFVSFLVLPASFFLVALTFFDSNSSFTLKITQELIRIIELLIDFLLAALELSQKLFPHFWQISIDSIIASSLLCLLAIILSPIQFRLKILSVIFLLPIAHKVFAEEEIPLNEMRVQLLDVGQGLSLTVETKKHFLVYDTGPAFGDNFDAGAAIVIPALLTSSKGFIKKPLDYLVLSHGDKDHIGGANSLLESYSVQNILGYRREFHDNSEDHFPEYKNWKNCEAGHTWSWDGVIFKVLYPESTPNMEKLERSEKANLKKSRKSNNQSCVLLIQSKGFSLLLPGDIEKFAEKRLLEQNPEVKADVLVAPHHGSKTSSEIGLLTQLSPVLVLVSAGFNNQFGHPHQEVLNRYEEINAKVLISAITGALNINSWEFEKDKPTANIHQARQLRKKFWRFD